jgi:hypothetical protein
LKIFPQGLYHDFIGIYSKKRLLKWETNPKM